MSNNNILNKNQGNMKDTDEMLFTKGTHRKWKNKCATGGMFINPWIKAFLFQSAIAINIPFNVDAMNFII